MRNWLAFFGAGPKQLIRRVGAAITQAGRGFLSGWQGETLESVLKKRMPGIPPARRRGLVADLIRKGEVRVPPDTIAITPEDVIRTAIGKMPDDIIIADVPWLKKIIDKAAPWEERFHYKIHYTYLEDFVDDDGVIRKVEIDDWITVTSKDAISRGEAIVRGVAIIQAGTVDDETPYSGAGITGIVEVHEIEYTAAAPSITTEFLRGFRGD